MHVSSSNSMVEAEQKFYDFLASHGHPLDGEINHDTSSFHRFKCPNGSSTDASYKFFSDGIPSGYLKCWKCPDVEFDFCSKQKQEASSKQWKAHLKCMNECKRLNNLEIQKRHSVAAKEAKKIWEFSTEENASTHPYLCLKQVQSYGLRLLKQNITYEVYPEEVNTDYKKRIYTVYKGTLLVPCYNSVNELVNLERIYWDAKESKFQKRPLQGGQRSGTFYMLGEIGNPEVIYIGEGYSTMAITYEAMNSPSTVTFSCNNIPNIVKNLRQKYPHTRLVIIADDDRWHPDPKLRHTGLKAAQKACAEFKNVTYLLPNFNVLEVPNNGINRI